MSLQINSPDDVTWREGIVEILTRIDNRLSDVESRLPSADREKFESELYEVAQSIHTVAKFLRRTAVVIKTVVVALGKLVVWAAAVGGAILLVRNIVQSEFVTLLEWFRK